MHRTDRRAWALVAGLVLALAAPSVGVAGERPGKGGSGGDRPDPRCRAIERQLERAQEELKDDQATHRKKKAKVATARKNYENATGERAKNQAKKKLNSAKKAAKNAKAEVEQSKDRLADVKQDVKQFDCAA